MTELDRVRAERRALTDRMANDPSERTYQNYAQRDRLDARIDAILNGKPRTAKRELPQRHCDSCGNPYTPTRIDNVYCSPACKQRAWRGAHGANTRWTPKGDA